MAVSLKHVPRVDKTEFFQGFPAQGCANPVFP
ncbi:hypothetical protein FOXG_09932 [Fusarium oxysporum f. sp. lycopersici 4287]|uniref:Uncharacterized protein n=2 Tax=Fusarium oxysporum TaxID=5507 RepID=A0A0J9WPN2_FUSO4|nr:hypothetical protein FOXG_09932 [Fusarium oxysporum f. sp. lycopersici 4287]EXK28372.1 hypothetical protein FOMG_15351 [Fusarium oxysporum f. sp. melonis 26406]KNB09327.1 hypothetical protein FOXG_09932 [Fusarium oxysporum f. sp. lycopersici 4287]